MSSNSLLGKIPYKIAALTTLTLTAGIAVAGFFPVHVRTAYVAGRHHAYGQLLHRN